MDNLELELKLTVAHINMILKHLAKGAYEEVSELIAVLHMQAKPQVEASVAPAAEETSDPTE
jgi:hypothetical protein